MLLYSARLRRRMVTRPGSGWSGSIEKTIASIHWLMRSRSSSFGCLSSSSGGMSPLRTLSSTACQVFGSLIAESGLEKESRATPPFFLPLPWHLKQYVSRSGLTSFEKSGAGAASAVRPSTAQTSAQAPKRRRKGVAQGWVIASGTFARLRKPATGFCPRHATFEPSRLQAFTRSISAPREFSFSSINS